MPMQNLNEVPRKSITHAIHSGTKHLLVQYKLPRTEAKDCCGPFSTSKDYFAEVSLRTLKKSLCLGLGSLASYVFCNPVSKMTYVTSTNLVMKLRIMSLANKLFKTYKILGSILSMSYDLSHLIHTTTFL